jgi:hypothetical protein
MRRLAALASTRPATSRLPRLRLRQRAGARRRCRRRARFLSSLLPDGANCGPLLCIAIRQFMRYVASDTYGSKSFASVLEDYFDSKGVSNLDKFSGAARLAAGRANLAWALEARLSMRLQLARAARESALSWDEGLEPAARAPQQGGVVIRLDDDPDDD